MNIPAVNSLGSTGEWITFNDKGIRLYTGNTTVGHWVIDGERIDIGKPEDATDSDG